MGYANDGPLTWVAECRVPWEPPSPTRLAIAEWMIAHGSDVHQGGNGPLLRAALHRDRIPMMQLLVDHGAHVNALWHGLYPILFAPCETLEEESLQWLLRHGADPDCRKAPGATLTTALDYLLGSYIRHPERLARCIDVLLAAGGTTRYSEPVLLPLLSHRNDQLRETLEGDPTLVHQRFAEWDFGTTGGRMLTLKGGTLLHAAAEFSNIEALRLLVELGADVDAPAAIHEEGLGGQTALFHAATQRNDLGLETTRFLLSHGADPQRRARVPGAYDREAEVLECSVIEYATRFPGSESLTLQLLRSWR